MHRVVLFLTRPVVKRQLAYQCNHFISHFIRELPLEKHFGPKGPNIVMTDFVDYNEFEIPQIPAAEILKNLLYEQDLSESEDECEPNVVPETIHELEVDEEDEDDEGEITRL